MVWYVSYHMQYVRRSHLPFLRVINKCAKTGSKQSTEICPPLDINKRNSRPLRVIAPQKACPLLLPTVRRFSVLCTRGKMPDQPLDAERYRLYELTILR